MSLWKATAGWVGVLLLAAAGYRHVQAINREMEPTKCDLIYVWVGTRLMLEGKNPYSEQGTRELQTAYYGRPLTQADDTNRLPYVYPATTAIVLAPLVALPWRRARLFFLLVMPLLTAGSVLLWVRMSDQSLPGGRIALLAAMAVASWPSMWALRLQQPALIVAALVAAGCFLLKRRNDVAAGVLLAMATIKPQTVCLLVAWLMLWALGQRAWPFLVSFCASIAAMLLAAEVVEPGWMQLWLRAISGFTRYQKEPALETVLGHVAGTLVAAVLAAGSLYVLWELRRCRVTSPGFGYAVALSLAVMVAVLPTMTPMIYNQVFLSPAGIVLLHTVPKGYYAGLLRRMSLGLWGWGFLATGIAALAESTGHASSVWVLLPFQNFLLPPVATAAFVMLVYQRTTAERPDIAIGPYVERQGVRP